MKEGSSIRSSAKEGSSIRREWVKNAAIIFLAVMLVLTFFSNTFMNYSLPEVATVYVQPGSITAKVRGTGNIEANDPYSVVARESRVITSVAVEEGDEVEKDAILYYLEDAESEELLKAESELNAMMLEHMLALFNGDATNTIINKVESGNTDSFAAYQSRIAGSQGSVKAAENNVAANQANVDNLTKQSNLLTNVKAPDTTAEQAAVREATEDLSDAQNRVTTLNARISNMESDRTDLEQEINAAAALVPDVDMSTGDTSGGIQYLQKQEDSAHNTFTATEGDVQTNINNILNGYDSSAPSLTLDEALDEIKTRNRLTTMLDNDIIDDDQYNDSSEAYREILARYEAAKGAYDVAKRNREEGTAVLQHYSQSLSDLASLENEISRVRNEQYDATKNVSEAEDTLESARQILTDRETNKGDTTAQWDTKNRLIEAEAALAAAKTQLDQALKDQTELIKGLQAELNLDNQNELITQKEEEIEKIKEKSSGSAIKAPVAGKVTSVLHVAGESIKIDEEIAVIQPAGKGFSLSFSVPNEQAGKVKVGDVAELQNAWYYEDVKVVLNSIRPDPDNPSQRKLLSFNLEGTDLQAGEALNISVGQRSSNYELVVPNSAIREDNNGKFVLVIEARNSPLGNRYYATRVDVEVLESDDTNTAITAGIYANEQYVITTATKPVTAGQQVRLTE